MVESELQQLVQIEGPKYACILQRNNSGALKDSNGRLVRYGLGNISSKQNAAIKSSDLIGITTITITPEMVGRKIGVFTAVECKAPGWKPTLKEKSRESAQLAYIEWVRMRGGLAGFASSIEEFKAIIGAL